MDPKKRKNSSKGPAYRRDPQPEFSEEQCDEIDPEEFKEPHAYASANDDDDDDIGVAEVVDELEDDEDDEPATKRRKKRSGEAEDGKGFFETIGDGLRTAGETAQRYTNIGVTRAGLEKLRFELKAAHAALGEMAMRAWADAPDLGLTSKDPAIYDAVKRVKLLRRAIREKQTKIAQLRKKETV